MPSDRHAWRSEKGGSHSRPTRPGTQTPGSVFLGLGLRELRKLLEEIVGAVERSKRIEVAAWPAPRAGDLSPASGGAQSEVTDGELLQDTAEPEVQRTAQKPGAGDTQGRDQAVEVVQLVRGDPELHHVAEWTPAGKLSHLVTQSDTSDRRRIPGERVEVVVVRSGQVDDKLLDGINRRTGRRRQGRDLLLGICSELGSGQLRIGPYERLQVTAQRSDGRGDRPRRRRGWRRPPNRRRGIDGKRRRICREGRPKRIEPQVKRMPHERGAARTGRGHERVVPFEQVRLKEKGDLLFRHTKRGYRTTTETGVGRTPNRSDYRPLTGPCGFLHQGGANGRSTPKMAFVVARQWRLRYLLQGSYRGRTRHVPLFPPLRRNGFARTGA